MGAFDLDSIVLGDALELSKGIPDDSIDLIFTDPPYLKKYFYLYPWLAETASNKLKTGKRLMSLLGHYQLPAVVRAFNEHLTYDWLVCLSTPGKTAAMYQKRVWVSFKPCLVYRKGSLDKSIDYARDLCINDTKTSEESKEYHPWGQGANFFYYYIERWTKPGDIVFDPFAGGGTVASVCKALNRRFLTFEIDKQAFEIAKERITHAGIQRL